MEGERQRERMKGCEHEVLHMHLLKQNNETIKIVQ
jgi:hypothetical protein